MRTLGQKIIYAMKEMPAIIAEEAERKFMSAFFEKKDFAGTGFTETVVNAWSDLAEKVCERPEFFHNTEHLMYIARKR